MYTRIRILEMVTSQYVQLVFKKINGADRHTHPERHRTKFGHLQVLYIYIESIEKLKVEKFTSYYKSKTQIVLQNVQLTCIIHVLCIMLDMY